LEKSNSYLSQVYICCFPSSKQRIASYIEQHESSLSITVVEVPEDSGSAEALATFKPVIKSDFIVISGDLVTDVSPNLLVNTYRALNPSMTSLFFDAALLESGERLNKEEGEVSSFLR
jgi:translation initiation factor eIF-2B subunit gamma